jgi:NAD(P)-dependent dehydrogenase (short-subunit alcohol dehydrogenase family)
VRHRDVVVITGASSGIGRACALAFARRGARLVLAARSESSLQDVASECRACGAEAIVVRTDVGDDAQVRQLAAEAIAAFGRIDVWVGAASAFAYGTFEATPPEVFRQVVQTGLFGQVNGARAVLPRFRAQRGGTLILVGSVYSKVTSPYVSAYVTAKFALLGFAEVLRQELRDTRIRVCTVLAATIDTPIYQHAANYTGQRVHPIPPITDPRRVARAIVRLARHPKPITVVGRLQSLLIPLHAAAPGFYDRGIRLVMNTLALRGGTAPITAGTVFTPQPQTNRVQGGWRSPLWRTVVVGSAVAAVVGFTRRR